MVASESLIKQIPQLLCPNGRACKFPTLCHQQEDLAQKVDMIKSVVKFQLRKSLCQHVAIGHTGMSQEQLEQLGDRVLFDDGQLRTRGEGPDLLGCHGRRHATTAISSTRSMMHGIAKIVICNKQVLFFYTFSQSLLKIELGANKKR